MPPATTMSASPALDHLVGQVDRVEPGQAHLVDRRGGHGHRDAAVDRGLAGGDLAGAGLEHLAHEHVVADSRATASAAAAIMRSLIRLALATVTPSPRPGKTSALLAWAMW